MRLTKNRRNESDDPRLILPHTPEFADAVERLAQAIRPTEDIPNGFDAPMALEATQRARSSARTILEMASELGLIGFSVGRVSADALSSENEIVLGKTEEEA